MYTVWLDLFPVLKIFDLFKSVIIKILKPSPTSMMGYGREGGLLNSFQPILVQITCISFIDQI